MAENTQAYFIGASVMKKKVFKLSTTPTGSHFQNINFGANLSPLEAVFSTL
jgi:hypothetical protein